MRNTFRQQIHSDHAHLRCQETISHDIHAKSFPLTNTFRVATELCKQLCCQSTVFATLKNSLNHVRKLYSDLLTLIIPMQVYKVKCDAFRNEAVLLRFTADAVSIFGMEIP